MSKLSKLVRTPGLYFYDALSNKTQKKQRIREINDDLNKKNPVKIKKKLNLTPSLMLESTIHLVILDNLTKGHEFKGELLKYQYRSFIKYTNIEKISYISEDIAITPWKTTIYLSYQDFYDKVILNTPPKIVSYIFIDLHFLFLRKINNLDFLTNIGSPCIFNGNTPLKNELVINALKESFSNNENRMSTALNFCCTNNMYLIQYNEYRKKFRTVEEYLYEFIPQISTWNANEMQIKENPIQFAYLDHGFVEKFIWILSIHGSVKCPPAINFRNINDSYNAYNSFLKTIVPHEVEYESHFKLKSEDKRLKLEKKSSKTNKKSSAIF